MSVAERNGRTMTREIDCFIVIYAMVMMDVQGVVVSVSL